MGGLRRGRVGGGFSPHWLLITLMSTLVTGEEGCLRGVRHADTGGVDQELWCLSSSILVHVQQYTSAEVRRSAAAFAPNIPRLAHFAFPDLRISPFPSDDIGTVFFPETATTCFQK